MDPAPEVRLLTLLTLLACSAPPTSDSAGPVCEERARLSVSASELDFGMVAGGDMETRTVDLRNDGDWPLGVTSLHIGMDRSDFSVELANSDCAETFDGVLVLPPGCVVTVTVGYAPITPGGARDALVVVGDPRVHAPADESGDLAYQYDWLHLWQVVWLAGTTDLVADAGPMDSGPVDSGDTGEHDEDCGCEVVGDTIAAEQTSLYEGESVELEVRAPGPGVTWSWSLESAEDGAIVDHGDGTATYTAPELEGCDTVGRVVNVYVVSTEEDGNTDWVFNRLFVWDRSVPLYCPDEPVPCPLGAVAGCGCGNAGAETGALFGLVTALGVARRERRKGQGSDPSHLHSHR